MDHVSSQQQHDALAAGGGLRLLTQGAKRYWFLALALLACAGFAALGIWQVERRAWKLDLIEKVDARIHAPAAALPGRADWPRVNAMDDAYRHVRATGSFLHGRETLVQAVTVQGAGFWVLTPLRTADGVVLVNRGFVPPEKRDPTSRRAAEGPVTVTGLLRLSEPGGAFLRTNDPAAGRWYSRDVAAIASAQGLGEVAPFFIDADAAPDPGDYPVGGLTVVAFPNNHLVYALTWFGLALLSAWGAVLIVRKGRQG